MSDKISTIITDQINKKDLEVILEVNRKSIEIETEVADQNEEIIKLLTENAIKQREVLSNQKSIKENMTKMDKDLTEMGKDLFRIKVLFLTGFISLIMQIIQLLKK